MSRSSVDFPGLFGLEELVKLGRTSYPDLYTQWCEIGTKLVKHRADPRGHALEHLDANIDLVLRAVEGEQLAAREKYGQRVNGGGFFAQISLSKMWLFSVYEIVRLTCDVPCTKGKSKAEYCSNSGCYRCSSLKPVRERLNAFRIPLAKLEPESSYALQSDEKADYMNYQPALELDEVTGSIKWKVFSAKTRVIEVSSRAALSDFVLKALL